MKRITCVRHSEDGYRVGDTRVVSDSQAQKLCAPAFSNGRIFWQATADLGPDMPEPVPAPKAVSPPPAPVLKEAAPLPEPEPAPPQVAPAPEEAPLQPVAEKPRRGKKDSVPPLESVEPDTGEAAKAE